jgi:pilus assembly protein CpaC
MAPSLMKFQRNLLVAVAAIVLALAPGDVRGNNNPDIKVTVGQSVTRTLARNVKTVSIADSDVADVVVAGPREILVNGKNIGLTTLVVWDDVNRSQAFDVIVQGPFSDQKIELRVKVAEINRSKMTEFGVDLLGFGDINGDQALGGAYGGKVDTPSIPLSIFNEGSAVEGLDLAFRYMTGGREFQTMIRALMSNGAIRVLAEPKMVASSGKRASFLSGGEIPVPIASAGTAGGTTVTIEWKEFGVKVDFLPTIVDSSIINLQVSPEVSTLDFSNGIQISGFDIPALRTRRADTNVELHDGEVLVIGGLIQEEQQRFRSRIPVLGHIPILGWFFSDYETQTVQNELLLVVSPRITRALPPGSPMPNLSMPFDEKEYKEYKKRLEQQQQGSN